MLYDPKKRYDGLSALNALLFPPTVNPSPLPEFLRSPRPLPTKSKDLKSPLTKKWSPFFYAEIQHQLARQTGHQIQRIRNITDGLTMPEISAVPMGGAKKMDAAILFFDLEKFTDTASHLPNEAVLYILNTIIPTMMQIVKYWNGEIEKNTGDGLMAIFGTETRNNFLIARDAIEAAMAMQYVMLADISSKFTAENLPNLNFRIGLDMAEVLVSRIGVKNTNFLTVVGDAANRASKLQTLAESNGICIGENVCVNLHPLLHPYCEEGKNGEWNWTNPLTKLKYKFFHYHANWPNPKEWIKVKL